MKNFALDRLKSYFDEYFSNATKPTAKSLFLIVVSILALDIFRSVRFAHSHMLSKLSDTSLNAYYYAIKTDRLNHESWRDVTVSKALRAVPDRLKEQSLFLSIDDTVVEKKGEKFELCSRLFDMPHITAPSAICPSHWATGFGTKNSQSWKSLQKWCAILWVTSARTGRYSCSVTASI